MHPLSPPISDCEHTSGYRQIEGNDVYHECKSCHETFKHQYNESGVCGICQHVCSHSAGFEEIDREQHKCTICNATGSHNLESDNNVYHFCSQCSFAEDHDYRQVGGHCVICNHDCDHDGKKSGECDFCQIKLGEHVHDDGSCNYVDETCHECFSCKKTFPHEWVNGYCNICRYSCPVCQGGNLESGSTCPNCERVLSVD